MNPKNNKKISKFYFLDSFRGFLAFTVALSHFGSQADKMWTTFVMFGPNVGIFGFFVLSSFLLTYRLLLEFVALFHISDKNIYSKIKLLIACVIKYTIRRVFRIYPMFIFIFILVKYGPSYGVYPFTRGLYQFPKNTWHVLLLINTGYSLPWTIHVEMTYYIYIPFICLFAMLCGKKYRFIPIVLLSLFALYADFQWTVQRVKGLVCYTCGGLRYWASVFASGSVTALVYYWLEQHAIKVSRMNNSTNFQSNITAINNHNSSRYSEQNVFEYVLSLKVRKLLNFSCYILSALFLTFGNHRWKLIPYWNYSGYTAFYNYPGYHWSLVLLLSLLSRGSFTNIFNNKFFNHLGKVSYSFYLTHFICNANLFHIMKHQYFIGFEGFTIFIFVSLTVSTVTYYLIEYPGMWMGNKLCHIVDSYSK